MTNYRILILENLLSDVLSNKLLTDILKISRQLVNHYLVELLNDQYIEKVENNRGLYQITTKGKKFLDQSSRKSIKDLIRLENMRYKFPILSGYEKLSGKYKIKSQNNLNNVPIDQTKFGGYDIRIIHSKNPSIEISCMHIFGEDLNEIEKRAKSQANTIAKTIEKQWKITLGEPIPAMKPDYAIPSSLATCALELTGASQIKTEDYIMNRSKGRGADFEAHNRTDALQLLLLPYRLTRIEKTLASIGTNYPVLFL